MAKNLKESRSLDRTLTAGSDVTFDYTCQPCDADNKTLEAAGICIDCSEFLCEECFRCHLKPSLMRHHKLLDIEEAKKDTSLSGYLDICTEKCPQHSSEVIKYFCLDHECLGCGVCTTLNHRNCQRVKHIPSIAKGAAYGEDFSNLISQLDMVLLQTKIVIDTSRDNKLKAQDIFDKVLDQVKHVRKEVNKVLDKLENEIETQSEKMKTMDMHKMDENIKFCIGTHNQCDILASTLKEMKQKGQYCNLFVAMTTNKSEIKSLVQPLEDLSKANSISDYLFQSSTQLENFLKHSGNLGQVCRRDAIKTKAVKMGEICVKIPSDLGTCSIRGMAMVASGRLVVADRNNQSVKLIDMNQSKVLCEYQLQCLPWDVTATEETGEVAVTQSGSCEIVLLRLTSDDKLYKYKEVKTTGECYGVACIKDKLLASITSPERLEIIDTQGKVLQTIVKNKNGDQLFDNVRSVAVDLATSTIYVPDCKRQSVTRLGLSGQVQWIYKDSQLKSARCVAVDKRGTVYVCGQLSNNIHQITPDSKQVRILLTKRDGLSSPFSLCYDGNKDFLFVGQDGDNLLVFQFS